LDDDDEWKKDKLKEQIQQMETNPNIGFVYTGTRNVDDSGNTLSISEPDIGGDVTKRLLLGNFISFSTILVDDSVVERAGPLDEYLTNWEDWEWCIRLSKNTDFGFVERPLVTLYRGSHEMRSDNFEKKRDIGFERFINKVMPAVDQYSELFRRKFRAHINYHLGYSALSNGYYSDARKRLFIAVTKWPFVWKFYIYFILSFFGSRAYRTAQLIKRWFAEKSS
jgi:hypothetical protein